GPSVTVRLFPENLTRAPFELAWSPSPASITPALASSSLNFPIAVRAFSSGRTPASESLLAFTRIMNRMALISSWFRVRSRVGPRLHLHDERVVARSTATNRRRWLQGRKTAPPPTRPRRAAERPAARASDPARRQRTAGTGGAAT